MPPTEKEAWDKMQYMQNACLALAIVALILAVVGIVLGAMALNKSIEKPPVFKAYATAAQTISDYSVGPSTVLFGQISQNYGGFAMTAGVVTIPKTGNYMVTYTGAYSTPFVTGVSAWVTRTGPNAVGTSRLASVSIGQAGTGIYIQQISQISVPIYFEKDDTMEIGAIVQATSGATTTLGVTSGATPTYTGSTDLIPTTLSLTWMTSGSGVDSNVNIYGLNASSASDMGIPQQSQSQLPLPVNDGGAQSFNDAAPQPEDPQQPAQNEDGDAVLVPSGGDGGGDLSTDPQQAAAPQALEASAATNKNATSSPTWTQRVAGVFRSSQSSNVATTTRGPAVPASGK